MTNQEYSQKMQKVIQGIEMICNALNILEDDIDITNFANTNLIIKTEYEYLPNFEVLKNLFINNVTVKNLTINENIVFFLKKNNYKKSKNYTLLKNIYKHYCDYCFDVGIENLGKNEFSKQLKQYGYFFKRENGTGQIIINITNI
jgi:hypothetical protein